MTRWHSVNTYPLYGVFFYLLIAILYCNAGPGIESDEALSVRGAMLMNAAPSSRAQLCNANLDIVILGRCWPLVIAPYAGATKSYFAVPALRVWGTKVWVLRSLAAIFGAIGIWGCSRFAQLIFGPGYGLLAGLVLAIQPPLADLVIFDDSELAVSFASLGLSSYFLSRLYLSRRSIWALALGISVGLGIWDRLNFLWIVVAVAASIAFCFRQSKLPSLPAFMVFTAGLLAAASPIVAYHTLHRESLFSFASAHSVYHSWHEFWLYLQYRLSMLSELFVSDGERRTVWGGPAFVDGITRGISLCFCLSGVLVALLPGSNFEAKASRCLGLTALTLAAQMLVSSQPIAEHHLAMLVPVASVCLVVFGLRVTHQKRFARIAGLLWLLSYACICTYWHRNALRGLTTTGGVGFWSSTIEQIGAALQPLKVSGNVKTLDWGFQDSIEFLSGGNWRTEEIYSGTTSISSGRGRSWEDEVKEGGFFLTSKRAISSTATTAFESALYRSHFAFEVKNFYERGGKLYARLYIVKTRSVH